MSVANLEAYALTQGITKAFDQMSQGEQTILRYQYLMQATADAQGDFVRTGDSFANMRKKIESAVTSISTSLGKILIPAVTEAATFVAGFLETLTGGNEKRTVLDDFNDIDLDTQGKLERIKEVSEQANDLIGVLGDIAADEIDTSNLSSAVDTMTDDLTTLDGKAEGTSEVLGDLAGSADKISTDSANRWSDFIGAFDNSKGFEDALQAAKDNDYQGVISGLATSLSQTTNFNKEDWSTMLDTLSSKVPTLNQALKDEGVSGAMSAIADAADDLGGQYPQMWADLVEALGSDAAVAMISSLSGGANIGTYLWQIAQGANLLDSNSKDHWSGLMSSIQELTGSTFSSNADDAKKKINELATALSGGSLEKDKATAFQELISTLSSDTAALAEVTGTDENDIAGFLEGIATAANSLEPDNVAGWDTLITTLATGLSGQIGGEAGTKFKSSFTEFFLSMGNESEAAKNGLLALGYTTDEIEQKQSLWLETCNRLVETIPGLSSIIDTETGAIEGGTEAVEEYVTAWRQGQEKLLMQQALYNKKKAILEKEAEMESLHLDALIAKRQRDELEQLYLGAGGQFNGNNPYAQAFKEAQDAAAESTKIYEDNKKALDEAIKVYMTAESVIADMPDPLNLAAEAADNAADSVRNLTDAEKEAILVTQENLKAVADYYESVRNEVQSTVDSTVSGLEEVITPGQRATRELQDITDQLAKLGPRTEKNAQEWDRLNKQINEFGNTRVSAHDIKTNLQSQIDFMNNYLDALGKVRAMGFDENLIASLSDGSVESADYLFALANATKEQRDEINRLYGEVQSGKQEMTDTLTDQKLSVDEVYDGLVEKARESIAALNLGDVASEAMGETISGLAQGITEHESEVSAAVDGIIAELDRLNNYGIFVSGFGNFSYESGRLLNGSHETGLDYVPFDNYLAALHEGEGVLTAEENRIWQNFKNGGRGDVDYDRLGGVMRDNVQTGGNVYLNGQVVGRVISDEQGQSLRNLTRAGWRS